MRPRYLRTRKSRPRLRRHQSQRLNREISRQRSRCPKTFLSRISLPQTLETDVSRQAYCTAVKRSTRKPHPMTSKPNMVFSPDASILADATIRTSPWFAVSAITKKRIVCEICAYPLPPNKWQELTPNKQAWSPGRQSRPASILLFFQYGGGGRTRTCEGIASGFTVRPLCRSGHSPEAVAPY